MLPRRAAGVAAAFFMLPFLLRGSNFTCPGHGDHKEGAAAPPAAEPMQGHEHHQAAPEQSSAPGEHSHPLSDCCPAMSSCAGGVAVHEGGSAMQYELWRDAIPAHVVTSLHTRVESPDPPPPKA